MDQSFVLDYVAAQTRDKVEEKEDIVQNLVYDRIFNVLLSQKYAESIENEINIHKAFEIVTNITEASQTHRLKLAEGGYYGKLIKCMSEMEVFESAGDEHPSSVAKEKILKKQRQRITQIRLLDKLSWLIALIAFHQDELGKFILELDILKLIKQMLNPSFPCSVRANSILSVSLLTYHTQLFVQMIEAGFIDIILNLCRDRDQEIQVKENSTLALVHFALDKRSINILIDKGVMDLFSAFSNNQSQGLDLNDSASINKDSYKQIQTNISWIFLALCSNGITGK
jgi:hypothetical protein